MSAWLRFLTISAHRAGSTIGMATRSGNMAPTSLLPISSFVDDARVRALDNRHHHCRAFGLHLRRADRHDGRDRGDRETKVNYAVIGAFVLVLGAVLVAGVLWLASGGAFQKKYAGRPEQFAAAGRAQRCRACSSCALFILERPFTTRCVASLRS